MTLTIGINGFGRIGRIVVRQLLQSPYAKSIRVAAVNDLTDPKTLAHLFKYDSVHRAFAGTVEAKEKTLLINDQSIQVLAERDPAKLPWKDLGVDVGGPIILGPARQQAKRLCLRV